MAPASGLRRFDGRHARSLAPGRSGFRHDTVRRMKYRNLGASGVKVSTLCLGGMTFGEADEKSFMHKVGSDEATAHAILDRALALGINFVDVADVYGQDGLAERVLGTWFA